MKKFSLLLTFCLCCTLASAKFPIDFSRVGYMWGEVSVPDYPVKMVLTAPADGSDMTAAIQAALDGVEAPGAVLLKAGTYNVSGCLYMRRDGVVLRGEGNGTVLLATGTERRDVITLGRQMLRTYGAKSSIVDKKTPVGQMWVRVADPSLFSVGDRVSVTIRVNDKWISGLKMDEIAQNHKGNVKQWRARSYKMFWERVVTKIQGDRVWLENPIVMELDSQYLVSAVLEHVICDRIEQSGIENMKIVSSYDPSVTSVYRGSVYQSDEEHAWAAIVVKAAEHCWIRNVVSAHFAYSLVDMERGAKNITVRECVSTHPVSVLTGARRDAFHISGGELCLVEKCRAEYDRHGLITGGKVAGPNVFLDCEMVHAYTDAGPHQRWATGVLYDNCITDNLLAVQDRAGWGTGHGWGGVNFVFWNCEAATLICQNPWISGKNWCIGCIGEKLPGRKYSDGMVRPDGEWKSHGKKVRPQSLYRDQFARRLKNGQLVTAIATN